MEGIMNRYVPLEGGPFTVELHRGAEVEAIPDVSPVGPGQLRVTPSGAGSIDRVVVIDGAGNRGEQVL